LDPEALDTISIICSWENKQDETQENQSSIVNTASGNNMTLGSGGA